MTKPYIYAFSDVREQVTGTVKTYKEVSKNKFKRSLVGPVSRDFIT